MELSKLTSTIIKGEKDNSIIFYDISTWKKTKKLTEITDNPIFDENITKSEKEIILEFLKYFP